jgi:hypothetical protein
MFRVSVIMSQKRFERLLKLVFAVFAALKTPQLAKVLSDDLVELTENIRKS